MEDNNDGMELRDGPDRRMKDMNMDNFKKPPFVENYKTLVNPTLFEGKKFIFYCHFFSKVGKNLILLAIFFKSY